MDLKSAAQPMCQGYPVKGSYPVASPSGGILQETQDEHLAPGSYL